MIALNRTMFLTQISHVFLSFYCHFLVLCSFFLCFQDSCHFRAFCEETSQNAKKLGFFKIFCTYGVQRRAGYRERDDVAHFHPEINCHVPMMWRFQAPRPRPPSPRPRPSQKGSRSKEFKGHAGPYAPQRSSINSFRFSFFSFIQA